MRMRLVLGGVFVACCLAGLAYVRSGPLETPWLRGAGADSLSMVLSADPGDMIGFSEAALLLAAATSIRELDTVAEELYCPSAYVGTIAGSEVLIATTGIGATRAALCVDSLLRKFGAVTKEVMFLGTAGGSPAIGGVLDSSDCSSTTPADAAKVVRLGDVCVFAVRRRNARRVSRLSCVGRSLSRCDTTSWGLETDEERRPELLGDRPSSRSKRDPERERARASERRDGGELARRSRGLPGTPDGRPARSVLRSPFTTNWDCQRCFWADEPYRKPRPGEEDRGDVVPHERNACAAAPCSLHHRWDLFGDFGCSYYTEPTLSDELLDAARSLSSDALPKPSAGWQKGPSLSLLNFGVG